MYLTPLAVFHDNVSTVLAQMTFDYISTKFGLKALYLTVSLFVS